MSAPDFSIVIQSLLSGDYNTRYNAETYLNNCLRENYPATLMLLTNEFVDESKHENCRQAAGLYLKNVISAQDSAIQQNKIATWEASPSETKEIVKQRLLQALASPSRIVGKTAAQAVSSFALVEIPKEAWPALFPTCAAYLNSPDTSTEVKCSTLDAIGFIFNVLPDDALHPTVVSSLLLLIIQNSGTDKHPSIRSSALSALLNSLSFAHHNFQREDERNAIMTSVVQCATSDSHEIKLKAYECLQQISELYYATLMPYVETIFKLSREVIVKDDEDIAVQAIEFWNFIATQEYQQEFDNTLPNLGIIRHFKDHLFTTFCECILKYYDDDESNVMVSAITCLDMIAAILKNEVLPMASPIVAHIKNPDISHRKTAIIVLGCVITGPDLNQSLQIISQTAPALVEHMQPQSDESIRKSSVWTISRFLYMYTTAWPNNLVYELVTAIMHSLDDKEEVACQCCLAINNLAEQVEDDPEMETNILSAFFHAVLSKLFAVSTRQSESALLKIQTYEAINAMVSRSAKDVRAILVNVINESLDRLQKVMALTPTDEVVQTQGSICGTMVECLRRLPIESIEKINVIMELFYNILKSSQHSLIHEEVISSMSYIIRSMGKNFEQYAGHFMGIFLEIAKKHDNGTTCCNALVAIGDVCKAIEGACASFSDDIIKVNIDILTSRVVPRIVKPPAIALFADVSDALGTRYITYMAATMTILNQATAIPTSNDDDEDPDYTDYANSLRESILNSYVTLLLVFNSPSFQEVLTKMNSGGDFLTIVRDFLVRIATYNKNSESVIIAALGLVRDLADILKAHCAPVLNTPQVQAFIQQSRCSPDSNIREAADFAIASMAKVIRA